MSDIKWMVLVCAKWTNIEPEDERLRLRWDDPSFGLGYAPIYETAEEAKRHWPNHEIAPLRVPS
jgi:hypothetical protein